MINSKNILGAPWLLLMVLGGLLSACSTSEEPAQHSGVIPEHQLQALDKAKAMEGAMQAVDDERRKKMEEAGI